MEEKLENLSAAVSLSVLEIDFYPNELIPAFLLANLMSPALWAWRSEKNAYNYEGALLSPKSRNTESVIGFSDESSFVSDKWIDLRTLSISSGEPFGLKVVFNANSVTIKKLTPETVEVG